MELKHLVDCLGAPKDPDGTRLVIKGDELVGAGFLVPIIDGVPDFVSHAPKTRVTLEFDVPDDRVLPNDVLCFPPRGLEAPSWFNEAGSKWEALTLHKKGLLIDAGAGYGNREIYERIGYKYIGLDADPRGLHSAPAGKHKPDLQLICDAHILPFQSNLAQVINSTAVLEHLYNPVLALKEMYRVLAPGGILLGSCSFLEGEHFASHYHMTALGLFKALTNAGFKVRRISPGASLWDMHYKQMFPFVPFARALARLVETTYYLGVRMKSRESVLTRKVRLAGVLEFEAEKPSAASRN